MPPVGVVDLAAADGAVRELLPEAGAIALRHFRTDDAAEDKGGADGYDPVTVADRGIEAHLRAGLAARFPEHRIVGEEYGTSGPAATDTYWMIDPIDGTKAYVSGVPAWGILVGLVVEGRAVGGWVHQPYLGETFAAVNDEGWFDRGDERRPLRTRATTELHTAIMYSTHPSMFVTDDERAAFDRVAGTARLVRYGGDCYSYCLLALGFIDLVVENRLKPYDIVALIPIIESAGGVVTDRSGAPPLEGGFVIAAATPDLHARALALVNEEEP
jgi:histidinol phosphatase-like enzyme (inositol monophosphatase family)